MRYILDSNFKDSLHARQEYLFEVFHTYFVPSGVLLAAGSKIYKFIVLEAFPFTYEPDLCVIYGHNYSIAALLNNGGNLVSENSVFIISCEHSSRKAFSCKSKSVYLAPQEEEYAPLLIGAAFGFDFNVTDAELNLYNSRKELPKEKLQEAFIRIN